MRLRLSGPSHYVRLCLGRLLQVMCMDRRTTSTCGIDIVGAVTSVLAQPTLAADPVVAQCVEDVIQRSG